MPLEGGFRTDQGDDLIPASEETPHAREPKTGKREHSPLVTHCGLCGPYLMAVFEFRYPASRFAAVNYEVPKDVRSASNWIIFASPVAASSPKRCARCPDAM